MADLPSATFIAELRNHAKWAALVQPYAAELLVAAADKLTALELQLEELTAAQPSALEAASARLSDLKRRDAQIYALDQRLEAAAAAAARETL